MRLEAIEKPRGIRMRFTYWGTKRQFGKVMTPIKVLIARMPASLKLSYAITKFELNGISLEKPLHYMISVYTSQLNGCGFCMDLGKSMAIRENLGLKKFNALADFRSSDLFTERERAALSYVEEATRNRKVSDGTFHELQKHFSDVEIAEITWLNAIENYYNLINIPLEIGSDGFCSLAERDGV